MSAGRTSWFARDAAWHRRWSTIELGARHGAAALAVLDVLSAWAQEQRDGGVARGGWHLLAREAFCDLDAARAIVGDAVALGVLLEVDCDPPEFGCEITGWKREQRRGRPLVLAAPRQRISRRLREHVFARDGWACRNCGRTDDLQIDHIHPWVLGGTNAETNLQALCGDCNRRKGARL